MSVESGIASAKSHEHGTGEEVTLERCQRDLKQATDVERECNVPWSRIHPFQNDART